MVGVKDVSGSIFEVIPQLGRNFFGGLGVFEIMVVPAIFLNELFHSN
jgi:hypothetical protein